LQISVRERFRRRLGALQLLAVACHAIYQNYAVNLFQALSLHTKMALRWLNDPFRRAVFALWSNRFDDGIFPDLLMRAAALCNEEAGWDGLIRHPVRQNSLVPPF
jgi:hypothetical protein